MCGITGIPCSRHARMQDRIKGMTERLSHRDPGGWAYISLLPWKNSSAGGAK